EIGEVARAVGRRGLGASSVAIGERHLAAEREPRAAVLVGEAVGHHARRVRGAVAHVDRRRYPALGGGCVEGLLHLERLCGALLGGAVGPRRVLLVEGLLGDAATAELTGGLASVGVFLE